jgi:hypothetical protein
MLRFAKSRDGVERCSIVVKHRAVDGPSQPDVLVALMSKAEVERVVRERYAMSPPEHWTEYGEEYEPWADALRAAEWRVAELWPAEWKAHDLRLRDARLEGYLAARKRTIDAAAAAGRSDG